MKLTLNTGREIRLTSLYQWNSSQMLEGLPTDKLNEQFIRSNLARAKELCPAVTPYLIKPEQTPTGEYSFGTHKALPSVICVAQFESSALNQGKDAPLYYSTGVIVWHQNENALPIDPKIEAHIQQIDWNEIAKDYEW